MMSIPLALDPNNNTGLQAEFPGTAAQGVLGLGPTSLSAITSAVQTGHSPLDQLFISNASNPFFTILFAGIDEPMSTTSGPMFGGFFSVGEPVDLNELFPGMEAVSELPDLSQITRQSPISLGSGSTFPIEQIKVNGQNVHLSSSVKGAPANSLVGIFTSTESLSTVPVEVAQAIYGSISGAVLDAGTGEFTVPCDTEINVVVQIGSVSIPLDPTSVVVQDSTSNTCVGSVSSVWTNLFAYS